MKKTYLMTSLLLVVALCAWAQGPNDSGTYYQNATNKSGTNLKTALHTIIKTHTNIGYSGLFAAYEKTDKRADGKVRDWYSCTTNYDFGDHGSNYSKEGDCYNREHTVPQSWFSEGSPMKADVVHVVPTDGYVNNRRSNYPFGEVNNATYTSNQGYCKLGSSKTSGYSGTVFEPNDEIKGDIARIYFYMATCYQDKCGNWSGGIFTSSGLTTWTLNMMMRWSKQDPVDAREVARNKAVYEVQGNRNPFVDYPGLEDYIWGDKKTETFSYDNYAGGGSGVVTTVAMPVISPDEGTYQSSVKVTISCATNGATIYYTTNGVSPTTSSKQYTGAFTLTETATVRAIAVKDGVSSYQASATFTIQNSGQGSGGEEPVNGTIGLNNDLFGTSYSGPIDSKIKDDLIGSKNGVTVVYALGEGGSNRYCNSDQIRLYQKNTLTISVAQGTMTEIEFQLAKETSKKLQASTGSVTDLTWTGNAQQVVFSVNDGSGNMQLSGIKVKLSDDGNGVTTIRTDSKLNGHRVIYNLRGQRVTNPKNGLYIVDGKKLLVPKQ